jgi:hypothetical protein
MRILLFIIGIVLNFISCGAFFGIALREYRGRTPYGEGLLPAFWLSVVGFPVLYLAILIISTHVLQKKSSVSENDMYPVFIALASSITILSVSAFTYAIYGKF